MVCPWHPLWFLFKMHIAQKVSDICRGETTKAQWMVAKMFPTMVQFHVSRSGLMRLRGDLNKVDIVITQMALENLQKRQVHLAHLGYLKPSRQARDIDGCSDSLCFFAVAA